MFKFDMIVDDSFCRLNERMIVSDSFSVSSFAKMANSKMTNIAVNIRRIPRASFSSSPGKLQYLHFATSWRKYKMETKLVNSASTLSFYAYEISLRVFFQLSSTIMNCLNTNMVVNDSDWKLKLPSTVINYHDRLNETRNLKCIWGQILNSKCSFVRQPSTLIDQQLPKIQTNCLKFTNRSKCHSW